MTALPSVEGEDPPIFYNDPISRSFSCARCGLVTTHPNPVQKRYKWPNRARPLQTCWKIGANSGRTSVYAVCNGISSSGNADFSDFPTLIELIGTNYISIGVASFLPVYVHKREVYFYIGRHTCTHICCFLGQFSKLVPIWGYGQLIPKERVMLQELWIIDLRWLKYSDVALRWRAFRSPGLLEEGLSGSRDASKSVPWTSLQPVIVLRGDWRR